MEDFIDLILGRRGLRKELETARREVTRLRARSETDDVAALRTITGLEDHVIQVAPDGTVEYINSSAAVALRRSKDALMGRPLAEIDELPFAPGALTELAERARATGETIEDERHHVGDDGRDKWHKLTATIEADGRLQLRVIDQTDLRTLEQTFARYVSPKVVEKMKALPAHDFFRAERTELTVLFGDLRGFTRAAQNMSAEEVRHTLNEYLGAMIDVADRHEAFVDKVVADEVMLLFGAPMPDPDHAARAVVVGLEMLEAQAALCARWNELGRTEIGLGIGVNTGEAVVGNIGSRKRMDYTVIGHAVNVASRLCDTAKAGELLVSADTRDALGDAPGLRFEPAGPLTLKNVSDPVPAFSVRRA